VSREKLEVLHVGIYRHVDFGTADMAKFLRYMVNLKVRIFFIAVFYYEWISGSDLKGLFHEELDWAFDDINR
jgi:hypothetical protein